MRCFIAIPLPALIADKIFKIQSELRHGLQNSVRWVNPGSIHLTLKFLGEIPEKRVIEIMGVVNTICQRRKPFEMYCSGLGVFPKIQQPRIIWVGISRSQELIDLQAELETGLQHIGIDKESRIFSPHLTIGRVHSILRTLEKEFMKTKFQEFGGGDFEPVKVNEIHLLRSKLLPEGPRYSVLHRSPLKEME